MIYGEDIFFWQIWKRRILAFSFLLGILCLTLVPIWQKIGIQPTLFLIILYYWALYRPDLLAVEQLVLISLVQDGVYAYPLGFSALRLLIDYGLLITQKRLLGHQRFLWIWGGFGLFGVVDAILYTILLSCVKHEWVGLYSLIPGLLLTASLYPLFIWGMNRFVMKHLAV